MKTIVEIFDFCSRSKFDREYTIRSQETLFEVIARATKVDVMIKTNLPSNTDRNIEVMEACDANPYPHYHYSIVVKHNGITKEARINEKKAAEEKERQRILQEVDTHLIKKIPKRKKKP